MTSQPTDIIPLIRVSDKSGPESLPSRQTHILSLPFLKRIVPKALPKFSTNSSESSSFTIPLMSYALKISELTFI